MFPQHYFNVFAYHNVIIQVHCQAHNKTQTYLPHNLEFTFKSGLIMTMNFQVIIKKTNLAEPNCGYYHQQHIHAAQISE